MKHSYAYQSLFSGLKSSYQSLLMLPLFCLLALSSRAYSPSLLASGNAASERSMMATPPKILYLSPYSASIGSGDLQIALTGTDFDSNSKVFLVGSERPTTVVSPTQIIVTLTAYDLAQPVGAYGLKIMDGSNTSNIINFYIVQPYYAKPTGDLSLRTTYGTNTDGTGTSPNNFTAPFRQYHVSGGVRTLSSNWTVSGTQSGMQSRVVVDANTKLIIPNPLTLTAQVDVSDGATLDVNSVNASGIKMGALALTSTVVFAQNASYVIPDAANQGYGNLTLRNGTKTLPVAPNNAIVRGNLLLSNISNFGGGALRLDGNLTLNSPVTFDPATKVDLTTTNATSTQVLDGAGTTLELRSLTAVANSQVQLAPNTDLLLGNSTGGGTGGGYNLVAGSSLSVGANTLRFLDGGQAAIGTGTGVLKVASSSLVLTKNGPSSLGTLRIDQDANVLNNLSINATGGANDLTLDIPGATAAQVLLVTGAFTLSSGQFTLGNNVLTLNGAVSMGAPGTAQFNGSTSSGLEFGGSDAVSTISFASGTGSTLGSLYMNRSAVGTVQVASTVTVTQLTLKLGVLRFLDNNRLIIPGGAGVPTGNTVSFVNALTQSAVTNSGTPSKTMIFPLGNSVGTNYYYRPLQVTIKTTSAGGTRAYTARQIEGRPTQRTLPTNPSTLRNVSGYRYFTLGPEPGGTGNPVNGGAGNSVSLYANGGATDGITNTGGLRVVRSSETSPGQWEDLDGRYVSPYVTSKASPLTLNTVADYVLGASNTVPGNPLPVTLTALAAQRESNGSVLVQWSTATEENNAYFELERSADGLAFGAVGQVAGNGNSSQAHTYSYADTKAPDGVLYYRLRQVDEDGQSTYSRVVVVTGHNAAAQIALYPNPATDQFTLTLPVALATQPVRVFDLQGRLVAELIRNSTGRFEVGALAAGTYFVRIEGSGINLNQRFVKL